VSLNGQTAIVTGAAKGIGAAIAERLAREGATVALADIDEAGARHQAEAISAASGQAFALSVDVSDPVSAQAMVESVVERTGRLDILVNNAGINGPTVPVVEVSVEEWRRVLSIDLDGVFYCCRAAVPHLVRRGYGRIVNIASIAGKEGNPNHAPYSAAKAGVIGFTKSIGKELATSGVLVNCVAPAIIETDLTRAVSADIVRYLVGRVPMGRMGQATEVAALVAWLCSPECTFSTGAVFDLSGGRATY
jgi:3-oxoacyl-[acyl-carrier protein] reductase